ncbi:MAG TPA: hypothetical protein VLJ57_18395 [Burkholderiaceae bacterium]|nr:hypothetical protein [Burkholderiaceae bacterium]
MDESASSDLHEVEPASPRSMGLLLAFVFAAVAFWPLWKQNLPHWWALVLSAVFLLLAILAPVLLSALTRTWIAFGGLLSKFAAPLALIIVFFGVFTPYGRFLRLLRRDVLKLRTDKRSASYWISRTPVDQHPSHFHRQF